MCIRDSSSSGVLTLRPAVTLDSSLDYVNNTKYPESASFELTGGFETISEFLWTLVSDPSTTWTDVTDPTTTWSDVSEPSTTWTNVEYPD